MRFAGIRNEIMQRLQERKSPDQGRGIIFAAYRIRD
jgi:hypothetical protein